MPYSFVPSVAPSPDEELPEWLPSLDNECHPTWYCRLSPPPMESCLRGSPLSEMSAVAEVVPEVSQITHHRSPFAYHLIIYRSARITITDHIIETGDQQSAISDSRLAIKDRRSKIRVIRDQGDQRPESPVGLRVEPTSVVNLLGALRVIRDQSNQRPESPVGLRVEPTSVVNRLGAPLRPSGCQGGLSHGGASVA